MKQFLKFTLASLVGTLLSLLIVFFILSGIIASIASLADKKVVQVEDNSFLHIKLDKPIPERTPKSPFSDFSFSNIGGFDVKNIIGLNDIKKQIERAKTDDKIQGIYLDLSVIPARMATVESIRNGLKDFKTSKKKVYAYADIMSQKAYYIASLADEVYLNPVAMMDFRGMSMNVMFFKGLLEKLDVDMQVIRYGEYKSAVEPFLLDHMSEANKEQSLTYIAGIWKHMLKGIKEEREVGQEQLNNIADSILLRKPEDALAYGLIDDILYKDELYDIMRQEADISEKKEPEFIAIEKYNKAAGANEIDVSVNKKSQVAVVYALGEIRMGEGDNEIIGSDGISEEIRKVRKDTAVKAIVLRVNSPGGSGVASDIIWREMVLAQKEKPVIVSMGDLAASGGYYIACPADKIYAQPNTLTGSIGVFGIFPNIKGLLNNKLGITVDGVKTNEHADLGFFHRSLSKFERDVLQENVDHFYLDFVNKVAEGREMTVEQVKEIGSGRIWSGIDAIDIGLIDEFGGLNEAVQYAAEMAEIEEYKVKEYPRMKGPFDDLFNNMGMNMRAKALKNQLGGSYRYFEYLKSAGELETIQARLPFVYEIH
ncbi:MAG: signal peptide peptidase SppA [Bacteroidales bacterium]